MVNVCHNCGEYRADKEIDPAGPYAVCPLCGFKHRFQMLPLLMIGGASGVGKTAVYNHLVGALNDVVLLEADILWRFEFDRPEDNYRAFFETWLRMSKNISQSGRPVALFGAGAAVPENVEPCVERRYFSAVHYLALTCDDDVIVERLKSRPAWRKCGDAKYIDEHVAFNRWFRQKAGTIEPPVVSSQYSGENGECRSDLLSDQAAVSKTALHLPRFIEKIRRMFE
jgi:DNA-directed RNA polymerase subunit RPC12/RpoP